MTRRKNEYEVIYGGSSKRFSDPTERYEDIYDEDGDAVICDLCGGEMKWKDNECVGSGWIEKHFSIISERSLLVRNVPDVKIFIRDA